LVARPVPAPGDWLAQRLTGWPLLVWPILIVAAARLVLYPSFEVTHALVDDWYNHATSFFAFLFGFLLKTIIIAVGHDLAAEGLPIWVEAPILIAVTALGCWLTFEIVRRIPPLRPLFGLALRDKPRPRDPALPPETIKL
jgi:hypothetical protein